MEGGDVVRMVAMAAAVAAVKVVDSNGCWCLKEMSGFDMVVVVVVEVVEEEEEEKMGGGDEKMVAIVVFWICLLCFVVH